MFYVLMTADKVLASAYAKQVCRACVCSRSVAVATRTY